MTAITTAFLSAVVAVVSLQCVHGYVHAQVGSMSTDCQTQYDTLIASIPEPTVDGELNCTDMIVNATANTDGSDCPSQAVLVACFQVISRLCLVAVLHRQVRRAVSLNWLVDVYNLLWCS